MNFVSQHKLIIFILVITLFKGVIWAYIVPPFQAPDEQVHYAEIQYYAEPDGYVPKDYNFSLNKTTLFDIKTQNLSPELRDYLNRADFEKTRFSNKVKADFINHLPFRDSENPGQLSRFTESYPAWLTNYPPLYYEAGSVIENIFSSFGVAEKSFFIRLFSVLLVTVFVFTAYLIFRELGLVKNTAALLAGAVSFQPMLTFIGASINVDSLLFAGFGMFLWGAIRIIKKIDWIAFLTLIVGIILSLSAKPSGYFTLFTLPVLALLMFFKNYAYFRRCDKAKKIIAGSFAIFLLAGVVAGLAVFYQEVKMKYFAGAQNLHLLPAYIAHQLEYPVLLGHSWFYWGNFGWLAIPIHRYFIYVIWAVLALSFVGVIKYLFERVTQYNKLLQKGDKRVVFLQTTFLIFCVLGFFLMIHAVNFQQVNPNNVADESAAIAIQGRYLFPVMAAKFYLVFLGLSYIFSRWMEKKSLALLIFLGMVGLNIAGMCVYVIPRFYF